MAFDLLLFYLFAAITVGGALLVVGQRNPIYSVVAIVGSFCGLSGLYVLLEAPFVAVVQIIIYAGAILVLFLFTVMLLNAAREDGAEWDRAHPFYRQGPTRIGAVLAVVLLGQLMWAFSRIDSLSRRHRRGAAGRLERAAARPRALHRLHVRLRGDLDPDHRGDGRRGRAGRQEGELTVVPISHYLILSGLLFAIGTAGVFLRRNVITLLLSVEVMLNAVNLTFVAFGRQQGTVDGQIITFFVMTVAAAEAAVGLAIVIALFRHRESLSPEAFTNLKW